MLLQLVFLRGFYAENDGDQFVVSAAWSGLTGRSRPSCGAHGARADSIEAQLDKKNTGKEAPFQVKGTSSESPSKTVQDDSLGLQFHALFSVFFSVEFLRRRVLLAVSTDVVRGPYDIRKSAVSGQNWLPKSPQACRASKTHVREEVSTLSKHALLGHKQGE